MKKSILLIVFITFCILARAQESQTVFNFLRIPVGAHVSALGGENISIADDDATLMTHNPALLQYAGNKTVALGYMRYIGETNVFSANYVSFLSDKATLGVAAQYVNYGKMKQTNTMGDIIGDFSASDLAIGATLSYTLAQRLSGGVTARFIYSSIADYHSTAVAADLGLNYYDEENDFSASIVAKNLGGQLSAYHDEYEKMPADLQVGLTKRFKGTPFRFSLTATDLTHWHYSFFRHLTLGADVFLSKQIYIAGGYSLRRANEMKIVTLNEFGEEEKSSHGAGLTIGAGINLDRFKLNLAYGKYHLSSSSVILNLAFNL